jgi:hypothetical protein
VNIGEVSIEVDSESKVSAYMAQHTKPIGYESGCIYFAPPPEPAPEIVKAAHFEAEQKKKLDFGVAV